MTFPGFQRSDYSHIREMLFDLHDQMLELPSKDDLVACARHLGLWHKKTLIFNDEYEASVLADYQVYAYRARGFNLAELYLRLNRSCLDDEHIDLLTRMSVARYLFLVVDALEEPGALRVSNILSGDSLILLDNGLSRHLKRGSGIAAHIINFGDFSIQSGAPLPIDREFFEVEELQQALDKIYSQYGHDVARITPNDDAKLARATISAAIRLGYTTLVGESPEDLQG